MTTTKVTKEIEEPEPEPDGGGVDKETVKCRYFDRCGNLTTTWEGKWSLCDQCQDRLEQYALDVHGEETLRELFPDSELLEENQEDGIYD